jgi:peptidyl-prolyl cis-trans isomerase A (cyclophilin A)
MRCLHAFFRWLIPVVGLPLFATAFTPSEDGIYAVFDTSEGEIVARLFYLQMPMTVGNFMRLADGAAQTLDQETGRIEQKRYYDGLTIDRVEAPFGIIGGAPGGRPEGGPGYSLPNEVFFIDRVEFLPFSFAQSGRLAMLDTGFNANGSQFFITTETESLNDTPTLFGKHSVFGEILSGMDRVRAIEAAPRDGNTLLVPVIINAITLVRKGALAEAFDPLNPAAGAEVPSMEPFPVSVRWESAEAFSLTYQQGALEHPLFLCLK